MGKGIKRLCFLLLVAYVFCDVTFSQDTLRILAIGNSFSEDAIEEHLHQLAQAEGKVYIVGNMFIGGCSLERHESNMQQNAAIYSYRKVGADGTKTTTEQQTLETALCDEAWDYISFQQVSQLSGKIETYFPYITDLLHYARLLALNPNMQLMLHQTWAYAQDATHSGFANYNQDQLQMYNAIVRTVSQVAEQTGVTKIIPSGTAIQNARASWLGDQFCRDGYHLQKPLGRYAAACAWFEALSGIPVVGNAYRPEELAKEEVRITQTAAHRAVLHPAIISDMSDL
ncbi:MAG: DUF4886 domain-containing protein [Candidatus Symbiothrix sp.]|jgi:hypothetical protein|nr:DUF4886 domain-containing protein [Candidatus Symbiothrix sp.]